MPVERRGQVIAVGIGSTGNGMNTITDEGRQPSCGDTSRMTRECQVRICEGLEVQFLGPTRQGAVGWETGQIRTGRRATWQAVANGRTVEASKLFHPCETDCGNIGSAEPLILW